MCVSEKERNDGKRRGTCLRGPSILNFYEHSNKSPKLFHVSTVKNAFLSAYLFAPKTFNVGRFWAGGEATERAHICQRGDEHFSVSTTMPTQQLASAWGDKKIYKKKERQATDVELYCKVSKVRMDSVWKIDTFAACLTLAGHWRGRRAHSCNVYLFILFFFSRLRGKSRNIHGAALANIYSPLKEWNLRKAHFLPVQMEGTQFYGMHGAWVRHASEM